MTNPVQICPSPISLELLKLFQGIACNNERLEGGSWGPELLLYVILLYAAALGMTLKAWYLFSIKFNLPLEGIYPRNFDFR